MVNALKKKSGKQSNYNSLSLSISLQIANKTNKIK